MYIGSSIQPKKRKTQHFSDLRNSRHYNIYLQRAFSKYGEDDFEWIILEDSIETGELADKEKDWIISCDTIDSSKGYNLTDEPYAPMRGKKHSEETIEKMGVKGCDHHNSKINDSIVQKVFDLYKSGLTQKKVALLLGIDHSNVSLILRGKAWKHTNLSDCKDVPMNNTSGCTGVYFVKQTKKWKAEIIRNKKYKSLGCFDKLEDAIKARKNEEVCHRL